MHHQITKRRCKFFHQLLIRRRHKFFRVGAVMAMANSATTRPLEVSSEESTATTTKTAVVVVTSAPLAVEQEVAKLNELSQELNIH